ncbi:MAG: thiamine phosphate synthase [Chloroflexi bacterium]|nr:thiamine phosphate synthase [Chloroflexota bacterium]
MCGLSSYSLEYQWNKRALDVLSKTEEYIARELRRNQASKIEGLYVIVDPQATRDRSVLEVAEAALEGGARVIQLRDKTQDKGDVLRVAFRLAALCETYNGIFIVNDHADLALVCGARGLHLGQHDLPIVEARKVLSPLQLIGRSNATVEEALESQAQGADYVAVGSIFPTATKENTRPAGLKTLRRVKELVNLPVVAIGGINETNVSHVVEAGAEAVCVVSAVCMADNPETAAAMIVERIELSKAKAGRP